MLTFTLKRLILAITVLFLGFMIIPDGVLAESTIIDDFDGYSDGTTLTSQGGWLGVSEWSSCYVENDYSFSTPNSAHASNGQCANKLPDILPTSGTLQFWFYFASSTDLGYTWRIGTTEAQNFFNIDSSKYLYLNNGVFLVENEQIPVGEWHNVVIEYDFVAGTERGRYDFGEWATTTPPASGDDLVFQMSGFDKFYFDSFLFGTTTSFTSCDYLPVDTCIATEGCYFNFVANSCFPVNPVYECGTGWFLGFCDTELACEDHGGYWYNNNCWETASATTTSFTGYYADHSDFATPTAFITFLSGFTSPFLENIENWLDSFFQFFDKSNAIFYGEKLGGAIPVARGYLGIFNSFFGDFPISEIFIFFIVALIIFVVYKQIRNLINLIKP